jgi:hypothetical protein
VGHKNGGTSTFSVLIVSSPNAVVDGAGTAAVFGSVALNPSNSVPIRTGPGGRVVLKFAVPNSVAVHAAGSREPGYLGSVSVTVTLRTISLTRQVRFGYGAR